MRVKAPIPPFLLAIILAASPVSVAHADEDTLNGPEWRPTFRGVDLAELREKQPSPVALFAVRIDLREPGISFVVTPSNEDRAKETDGVKTSTFLKNAKCQLAINASPYDPVEEGEGNPKDILGLSVSCGDLYSPPHPEFGALLISKENRAWIAEAPVDTAGAYNGVGGFHLLLKDGKNIGDTGERHPRTAVGISKDQRYLYFLIIDGRQPAYSVGATTHETAERIRWAGAHSALNLDGGGSTALVVAEGNGRAKVLNRPIHNKIPGAERVVGNHLGVFAAPLGH